MSTRREVLLAGTAAALALAAAPARAQPAPFPSRPIRLVVPFPPGGAADVQARLLGEHMARTLGQPVVVENRPGGGTVIGTTVVAQAPADGHTLLMMANSFVINAKLHAASLPYKGLKAFQPVACLTNSPQLVAVNSASPWRSFGDWIAAARAKPGTVTYSTVGPATTQHIAGEMLLRQAGVRMIYVPYPGGSTAVNALLGGHTDSVLTNFNELQAFLDAGKLRALAVTLPQRLASLPQVPTVAESGLPGYEASAWFGLVAPAGTPREAVDRLSAAALAAMGDAGIRRRLVELGFEPYPMDAGQFAAHIDAQYSRYARVIDEAGIKA